MLQKSSTVNKPELNKADRLARDIADAVGAGKVLHLPSVDFSDPMRPKTCLEVDFPILPINHIAAIEGNAGKPIYQMSKWWARRRSSVFRAMLLAAATQAPDDPTEAAKLIWNSYYGNHQKNKAFQKLKVADKRIPTWERQLEVFFGSRPSSLRLDNAAMLLKEYIDPTLQRELLHRGLVDKSHSYDTTLVGWMEVVP